MDAPRQMARFARRSMRAFRISPLMNWIGVGGPVVLLASFCIPQHIPVGIDSRDRGAARCEIHCMVACSATKIQHVTDSGQAVEVRERNQMVALGSDVEYIVGQIVEQWSAGAHAGYDGRNRVISACLDLRIRPDTLV